MAKGKGKTKREETKFTEPEGLAVEPTQLTPDEISAKAKRKAAPKKKAPAKAAKVLTRKDAVGKVILPTFSELRLKGGMVSLTDLPKGTRLHRIYKGQRHDFVVDGPEAIRQVKPKAAGPWASLSSAAGFVSGHAERGSIVLRTEDGALLYRPPAYGERTGAAPKKATGKKSTKAAAKKPARAKKGNGKDGTVKVTPGARCGHAGCKWVGPMSAAAAHAATHEAS